MRYAVIKTKISRSIIHGDWYGYLELMREHRLKPMKASEFFEEHRLHYAHLAEIYMRDMYDDGIPF